MLNVVEWQGTLLRIGSPWFINPVRLRFSCHGNSLSSSSIFNCFVYLQGILHHISALSEKKGEAENSAKENKVPF